MSKRKIIIPFRERAYEVINNDYYDLLLDLPPNYIYRRITIIGDLALGLTPPPENLVEISISFAGNQVAHEFILSSMFAIGQLFNYDTTIEVPTDPIVEITYKNSFPYIPFQIQNYLPSTELQRHYNLISDSELNSFISNNSSSSYPKTLVDDINGFNNNIYRSLSSPTYTFDPYSRQNMGKMGGLDARGNTVQIRISRSINTPGLSSPFLESMSATGDIFAICDVEDTPQQFDPVISHETLVYLTASKANQGFLDIRPNINMDITNSDSIYAFSAVTSNFYKKLDVEFPTDSNTFHETYPQINGYQLTYSGDMFGYFPTYANRTHTSISTISDEPITSPGFPALDANNISAKKGTLYLQDNFDSTSGGCIIGYIGKVGY